MNDTQPRDQAQPGSPPQAAAPPPSSMPPSSMGGFFDQIRSTGIRRSSDRWIAGVGGGLARRFGVDPLLIRAGLIALLIFGVGFLAYLIAWALIPDEDDAILAEKAIRDGDGGGIFLLIVIGLSIFGIGPIFSSGSQWWSLVVTIGLIAGIWWLVTRYRGSDPIAGSPGTSPGAAPTPAATGAGADQVAPEPVWAPATARPYGYEPRASGAAGAPARPTTPPRPPKARGAGFAGFLIVVGTAVLGYGIGQLIGDAGSASATLVAMIGATTGAGLATMALGLLGRRAALGGVLSIGLALSMLAVAGEASSGTQGGGAITWQPLASSTTTTYAWNAGEATLDLREMNGPPVQPEITANVSFGVLVIYLPEGLTTRVISSANLGAVIVDRPGDAATESQGGTTVSSDELFGESTDPDLTIRANVNLGSIRIVPAGDPS